ncbi:DinB family protein [Georgenia sp. TF02-10]|uniref:mycothiol transferase n=1 Tax=Georgenia sp. TF02-10 TaxID=2917725 RepID=UPI002738EB1A|nr:DinB family protein [Georgenia sp. TF02-10]
MNVSALLTDAYARVPEEAQQVLDGLTDDELTARIDPAANPIAWLVWHLARGEDAQIADVAGSEQVWTSAGWQERFGLPFGPGDTGYGHTSDQVAQVRAPADLLTGYLDAVHRRTSEYLAGLTEADLDRVVDEAWDPPVTLGVRLVSIVADDLEHLGQAAYVRGILLRARG